MGDNKGIINVGIIVNKVKIIVVNYKFIIGFVRDEGIVIINGNVEVKDVKVKINKW